MDHEFLCEIDTTSIIDKLAMAQPETTLLSSRPKFAAFDNRLSTHTDSTLSRDLAVIEFVESGSINYCLCAPLVSCTIMYSFWVKG